MKETRKAESRGAPIAPIDPGSGRVLRQGVLDGVHECVVRLDAEDRVVDVSRAPQLDEQKGRDAKRHDAGELVGSSIYDFMGDREHLFRELRFDEVRRTGVGSKLLVSRTTRRGEVLHFEVHCVRFPGDAPHDLLVVSIDVSARIEAQRALEASETLSHEASCVIGIDGIFTRVSGAWGALGWAASDLLGRSWIDFVHPDDRASARRAADHEPPSGQSTFTFETRFRSKRCETGGAKSGKTDANGGEPSKPLGDDETYRLLSWNALRHEGEPVLYASARDVTDTRRIEAHLRIAERMASLGTLAAGVAHEINNPLAYIQTNLEFVGEELADISGGAMEEIRQALGDAADGLNRVRTIVGDLRMFARVDEEQQENVDVASAIEAAVNLVSGQIRQSARLVCRLGPVPRIQADPTRLSQIFVNLLINAVQAFGPNVERNEITIVADANAAGEASIEFRDNGCGISRDHMARIFDPFFTTKPVGVGTGLGLAISNNLVTAMGGRFEVESEIGLGTTFRILFPACLTHTASPPSAAPADRAKRVARSRNVLVIDDEALLGVSIRRVLPEHTVTLATSPHAALDRIAKGELFDVILCDVIMPTMGAQQFIPALMKASPTLAARVILTSGGMLSPEVRAFVEKAPRFLPKPFDADQLRSLIDEVCNPPSIEEVEPIETEGAQVRMIRDDDTVEVTMSGVFDTDRLADALHVFASSLHACAQRTDVDEVIVDFCNVSFLSSSCFKAFVTWVGRLEDAAPGEKYRISVRTDVGRKWQARSFGALTCFAPDHLRVDAM